MQGSVDMAAAAEVRVLALLHVCSMLLWGALAQGRCQLHQSALKDTITQQQAYKAMCKVWPSYSEHNCTYTGALQIVIVAVNCCTLN